jgi:hypothetical protein
LHVSAGFIGLSLQGQETSAAAPITLFCAARAVNSPVWAQRHIGGYFASSSWAFVTESDVVLNRQAIASGMGLWCQAYQGTLAG